MSLSDLYLRAPVRIQSLLLSAYGLVLRRRRYGGVHKRCLRELLKTQWCDAAELRALQLHRLNQQLKAAAQVQIYRRWNLPEQFGDLDELERLPILSKDDLRRPRDEVVSGKSSRRGILEVHTGGTTGKPLSVYCDRAALQRNYAFFERFKQWTGVGEDRPQVATFAGRTIVPATQQTGPYWRYNGASRTMLFSSYHISEQTIPAYVKALSDFRPTLIDSYPSSIEPIAEYLSRHESHHVRPKAVITSSETLTPQARTLIENAFGCPVFDHYGAAEMAALITQCEHGTYHSNPEFGIVEILKDGVPAAPGDSGELVATGFVNSVMPLLRYATGDRAVRGEGSCRCGRAFPVIERLEGRNDDVLLTPEGRRIGRLDPIFKSVKSFYETRLIQVSATHVRVETVPARDYDVGDEAVLLRELSRRLGPSMTVDLVKVDHIPRTPSGKFQAVINRVNASSVLRESDNLP